MTQAIHDNRRTLRYPGDARADTLGRIMGPNTFGELMTVVEVFYDEEIDRTICRLQPTRQVDLDMLDPDAIGRRTTRYDGGGPA